MTGGALAFETDPPLTPELRSRIEQIWLDVTRAGGAVGGAPTATLSDLEPVIDNALGGVTDGTDHMILARLADEIVGFGFLSFRPGPLFRHWATVKRLQVHPSFQKRGFGGALLDELIRVARDELGLEQLHLTVRGGTGTEGLYISRGFRLMARLPDVIRLASDDTREELYMVARL